MGHVRSTTINIKSLDGLIKKLSELYPGIVYPSNEHYRTAAESKMYHPEKDLIENGLKSLESHFQRQIKPVFDFMDKRTSSIPSYDIISRTYRAGDHQDYWLCTATLSLNLGNGLFLKQQLMQFDEGAPTVMKSEQISLVDYNGNEVSDLKRYLTNCSRI